MTVKPFHYRISGLVIASEFELDEAEPCDAAAVDVHIGCVPIPKLFQSPRAFREYRVTPEGDLLDYEDVGRFLVPNGSQIWFDPEEAFDLRCLGIPLLGPVFALLLHRRGHFVLHGSAVEIDGRAHVFLGDKGAGKSTTAVTLLAGGLRLIADDVVPIERTATGFCVHPGYPAMKIDRAMLTRFEASDYRIIEPDDGSFTAGKARVRFLRSSPSGAIPLGPVHRLGRGAANGLTPLSSQEALQTLIRFSYYPRFDGVALAPKETAALFAAAAKLVPHVEVHHLTVKDSLAEIAAIVPFLVRQHALISTPE